MGAAPVDVYPAPIVTTALSRAPHIRSNSVTFTVPDPEESLAAVKLCQEITRPRPGPDFTFGSGLWKLRWTRPPVDRLEYKFQLDHRSGDVEQICDPHNAELAPGPFGEKSVVRWPEYAPPPWVGSTPTEPGSVEHITIPSALSRSEFHVLAWTSPGVGRGDPAPLLIVHDGPEYDSFSELLLYLGTSVEAGAIPPMRAALLPPVERDNSYSASALYARVFGQELLPALMRVAPTPPGRAMRVGMGASLGALAMLHVHRTKPATFGALFLQSGSYFRRRFDPQESSFVRFSRIVRFVGKVSGHSGWTHPIPVAMTCGSGEENLRNNLSMRDALVRQGYDTRWYEVRDSHNWIAWRDSFDPALGTLLRDLWA
jgi:enterochelin esterase-like enzyme